MTSSLKEQFARLGPVRAVDRVASGSPTDLVLRTSAKSPKSVLATLALARRGLTLLRAKRTVEAAMEHGEAVMRVPMVEDMAVLAGELVAAGFRVAQLSSGIVDVKGLRTRLAMTQEQFALRYGFELDALQNWEQGRRTPDRATAGYLRVINRLPREAAEAQEEAAL